MPKDKTISEADDFDVFVKEAFGPKMQFNAIRNAHGEVTIFSGEATLFNHNGIWNVRWPNGATVSSPILIGVFAYALREQVYQKFIKLYINGAASKSGSK